MKKLLTVKNLNVHQSVETVVVDAEEKELELLNERGLRLSVLRKEELMSCR